MLSIFKVWHVVRFQKKKKLINEPQSCIIYHRVLNVSVLSVLPLQEKDLIAPQENFLR